MTLKATIIFAAMAMAALSAAPILDKPGSQRFYEEQTQGEVSGQQGLQGTYDVVGEVVRDTDETDADREQTSDEAGSNVASVSDDGSQSAANLRAAEEQMKNKSGGGFWVWSGLIMLLGIAAFAVFRFVAEKYTPSMPTKRKVRW